MQPIEFLYQAKSMIAASNATEVERRSAISRAYYYLFNETRDFLSSSQQYQQYDQINQGQGSHEKVGKFLRKVDFKVGQTYIGFKLDRNRADYELKNQFFNHTDCNTKIAGMVNLVPLIKGLTI